MNPSSRSPAENAELALLLEVAATPKPGNVDRHREYPELRFEHFLAGAAGARDGLERAADGEPLGTAFERAVAGMARQRGGNTQFGCLLLLVPLVKARADRSLTPTGVGAVTAATTVEDAVEFYRAFEHVEVAVSDLDRPASAGDGRNTLPADLDVRRGSEAIPAVRERGLSLAGIMELGADHDANAREWVSGFPRTFDTATAILNDEGSAPDRIARAFLGQLAAEPDSLIATRHGVKRAREVRDRAAVVRDRMESTDSESGIVEAFAEELIEAGINPGTTADIVAGGTYVALERGLSV